MLLRELALTAASGFHENDTQPQGVSRDPTF